MIQFCCFAFCEF